MKKSKKNIINVLVLISITLLVLYFSLKDNFSEIMKQILELDMFWFLFALFLVCLYWGFRAYSIHTVIVKFKKDYTIRESIKLTMITQFFNAVTPFATGGQPFQVYALKKDGVGITDGTNIIMQNFIVYQVALVLLGIFAVTYNSIFGIFKSAILLKHLVTIGFLMNTLVVVFLFLVAFGKRFNTFIIGFSIKILNKLHLIKDKEKKVKEWNTYISNFHKGAKILLQDKKTFILTTLANFISLLCLYAVPVALLYGMGNHSVGIVEGIVASSYTMLMGAFVPIPGGTGGLEYGYMQFFGEMVTGPTLNASMLLWRGITYYLGMVVGAIFLNIKIKKR